MPNYPFFLKPSRYSLLLLFVAYLGAIIITLVLSMPIWLKWALVASCLFSLIFTLYNPLTIVSLQKNEDDSWQLYDRKNRLWTGKLQGNSICTTILIILNFKVAEKRRSLSVVIWRDALKKDEFRELRVKLLK